MLNNFKITGKLTIGFGIVLALFGVAVFFSWTSISAVQSDVQYLQKVVDTTVKLAVELTNQISWIRAHVRDLKFSESDQDIDKLVNEGSCAYICLPLSMMLRRSVKSFVSWSIS